MVTKWRQHRCSESTAQSINRKLVTRGLAGEWKDKPPGKQNSPDIRTLFLFRDKKDVK
jgi:hypothetical protein